jgi:glucose-1-phosphate adenylyltransferase
VNVKAVVLAGGEGSRLTCLTTKRAKPAVPFAGKYRIIDFTLSNCVNSHIFDVLILTQYRPHSLHDHIGMGRPWDLDRTFTGGIRLLQPYKGQFDTDWYAGTADAVMQNLNFVRQGKPDYVLILSGDHIYKMDYETLIQFHRAKGADATACTFRVSMSEASRFGIFDTDANNKARAFVEKPQHPPGNLANMGVYLFNYEMLEYVLREDRRNPDSSKDFGKDILPWMMAQGMNVYTYPYDGYWIDVGTIDAYWQAHMDILASPPALQLYDREWVIHTRSEERPPVRIADGATVRNSMIADGTRIAPGAVVECSVLSPGVYVSEGAVVRESIVLTDTYIDTDAVIERCIIDKIVVVGHSARVGALLDSGPGPLGITSVGKNTRIPPGFTIGHRSILGADVTEEEFKIFPDQVMPPATRLGYPRKTG